MPRVLHIEVWIFVHPESRAVAHHPHKCVEIDGTFGQGTTHLKVYDRGAPWSTDSEGRHITCDQLSVAITSISDALRHHRR